MKRIIALPAGAVAVAALAVATAWGGPAIAALGKTGHQAKPTAKAKATTDPPVTFDSELKRGPKKFHLRKVIISTGFGGEAGSVARHHPAG